MRQPTAPAWRGTDRCAMKIGPCPQRPQLKPLFLIQSDRKPPHAIDRQRSLLAHLHPNVAGGSLFEGRVFLAQALKLSLQIFIGHKPLLDTGSSLACLRPASVRVRQVASIFHRRVRLPINALPPTREDSSMRS